MRFIVLISLALLITGCYSLNNAEPKKDEPKVISACKKQDKIYYEVTLKVPNYCYTIDVNETVEYVNDTALIYAKLVKKAGLCAQSIKTIVYKGYLNNVNHNITSLDFVVENTTNHTQIKYQTNITECELEKKE